jgi:beta-xylosidase
VQLLPCIRRFVIILALLFPFALLAAVSHAPTAPKNPVIDGWYADPDIVRFGDAYWIYPTTSDAYDKQTFLDAFSSTDLVSWTKHERILDADAVKWAKRAMWAPCAVENGGKHYLFFAANDVHAGEVGGIGVAVGDAPAGPFTDLLGRPLINEFHNGAQPIDQSVFKDPAGQWWIVYGGWKHCNIAKLASDFRSLVPFDDGTIVREITPEGYVEGPMMFFRNGKTCFMWSEGGWTDDTYRVAYAVADSPLGPFTRIGTVITPDASIATGAGHHSVLHLTERDEWFIAYHRRPAGDSARDHRVVCIDRLEFEADGTIKPVTMTTAGVEARPIKRDE